MRAIDIVHGFVTKKEIELSIIDIRINNLTIKRETIKSGHDLFENDITIAKLKYRKELVNEDINYLQDKISKLI